MNDSAAADSRRFLVTVHYSPRGGGPRSDETGHFQMAFRVRATSSTAATTIALAEFQHAAGLWREEVERVGVVPLDG